MPQGPQEFFRTLRADAVLQAACSEAMGRGDLDAVVGLAAEAGFTFTVEDLRQAWAKQAEELSQEDVAKAAGGMSKSELIQKLSDCAKNDKD